MVRTLFLSVAVLSGCGGKVASDSGATAGTSSGSSPEGPGGAASNAGPSPSLVAGSTSPSCESLIHAADPRAVSTFVVEGDDSMIPFGRETVFGGRWSPEALGPSLKIDVDRYGLSFDLRPATGLSVGRGRGKARLTRAGADEAGFTCTDDAATLDLERISIDSGRLEAVDAARGTYEVSCNGKSLRGCFRYVR